MPVPFCQFPVKHKSRAFPSLLRQVRKSKREPAAVCCQLPRYRFRLNLSGRDGNGRASLFKGKYNAYRVLSASVNVLLLAAMLATAFCGMAMSGYAVPFLYWPGGVFLVRPTHLAMSHWAFVLMGLHLGLHVPVMLAKLKPKDGIRRILSVVCAGVAGAGLWLFFKNGMPNYLFFRVPFAFLDYEKAGALVLLENVVMLLFWAFVGCQAALLCRRKGNPLVPVMLVLAAAVKCTPIYGQF